jgi:hypothetical protein
VIQDLGLSAFDYAVDHFHDPIFEGVTSVPRRVKSIPKEAKKVPERVRSVPRVVKDHIPGHHRHSQDMSHRSRGYDDEDDGYGSDDPGYDGVVGSRPGYAPGDGFAPGEKPYAQTERGSRSGRSGRGVDDDTYESYENRSSTARDGYARDATSDAFEERGYGYGDRSVRGKGYDRGYEQPAIEYGSRSNRSQNDLGGRDEYYEKRREEKRSRSRGRRDRAKSRESSRERDGGNDDMKKWAATIAGAAAGGFAGHKAKKDNWIPAAIGAVVGGLVAREAEKEVYRRKERYDDEKNAHSMRRSKSR